MIPWKTYAGRRNINLAFIIDSNPELSDYNAVSEHYRLRGIEPPSSEEYESALKHTRKDTPKETQAIKEVKAPKRSRATSKKSEENPDELWEDAKDGAYQAKKTTTRKKTSTRKTSTRKKS